MKSDKVKPVEIFYRENLDDTEIKQHFHNAHELVFVLEGKARFEICGKAYAVQKNSLVVISNFESHNLKVLEFPYKRYYMLITPDFYRTAVNHPVLSSVFRYRPNGFNPVLSLEEADSHQVICTTAEMLTELEMPGELHEEALKAKLMLLFIQIYRSCKKDFPLLSHDRMNNLVFEIQKYLEEKCAEPINLSDMASRYFVNMHYLSHMFKKITGFTFKEYLLLQRTTKAKELLYRTDDTILQVCLNSGFNNVNNFIRIFKKYEGITPHQYRKNCKL